MSGGADPRSTYVDEGVLGSGFLGWAFDAMPADETQPPMPMTHHSGHHHHYARNQPHRPQHPYQVNPGNVGGAGQFAMPQPQARHRSSSGNLQDPGRHSSSSKHFHHHHQLPSANVHGGIPYGNTLVPPPPPARPPVNVGSGGLGAPVASSSSVARRSGGMPAVPGSSQSSTCQYCGKSYSRPDYLSTHIAGKHSGRKMWSCKICGKEYRWRSSLSHHQKTAHEKPDASHVPRTSSAGHSHGTKGYRPRDPGHSR